MSFKGENFLFSYMTTDKVNPSNFQLHTHNDTYEILIFIDVNAVCLVEGSVYPLKSHDIVFMNPMEFHRVKHNKNASYSRFLLMIEKKFFADNNCFEYKNIFDLRKLGENNLIPAEYTEKSGIYNTLFQIKSYIEDGADEKVISCKFIEILYLINKFMPKGHEEKKANIAPIISYINENLSMPLTAETLSKHFFINKSYLCRAFKKHTGFTISSYINKKRLVLVKQLYQNGKTLTQSCIESGFSNYSTFYKLYMKEYGIPPRQDLKEKYF